MLVTKYQISAINSYWEKCDEIYLGRTEGQTDRGKTVYPPPPSGSGGIIIIDFYSSWQGQGLYIVRFLLPVCRFCWFFYKFNIHLYMHIFRRIFLSNYWWQESDIWSQASYRYAILWEAFLDPSDSYFRPKTLPTIWGTYMTLVTKYQISVINSCWEKRDEKCAYMFNVYKNQLSRQTVENGIKYYNSNP
jgi:hypothetical protein